MREREFFGCFSLLVFSFLRRQVIIMLLNHRLDQDLRAASRPQIHLKLCPDFGRM
jgi:hypothetical protein